MLYESQPVEQRAGVDVSPAMDMPEDNVSAAPSDASPEAPSVASVRVVPVLSRAPASPPAAGNAGEPPADVPAPMPVDPAAETLPLAPAVPAHTPYPGGAYLAATSPDRPQPHAPSVFAQPLTRTQAAICFWGALLVVVVAVGLALVLAGGEWATGATAAGVAGLLVGIVYALGTLLRVALGLRAVQAILLGLAATLLFASLGGAAFASTQPLHQAQAQFFEAGHDWSGAEREYTLAGQHGPASRDVARVYVEWGDALQAAGRYSDAADRYVTVISLYPGAAPEVRQAGSGLLRAYLSWLDTAAPTLSYPGIVDQLARAGVASWCDTSCRALATAILVQARYQYGTLLAARQQYAQAAGELEAAVSLAPSGAYAAPAHAAAARAYYALGQSQLTGATCTDAVPTFQKLSNSYADTPEGAHAKAALAAPEDVTGTLLGYPTNPAPSMYLSRHINGSTYFSDDYSASLGSGGHFTFKRVAQGNYNLSAAFGDGHGVFWYGSKPGDYYNIVVGPLCTLTLAPYTWT